MSMERRSDVAKLERLAQYWGGLRIVYDGAVFGWHISDGQGGDPDDRTARAVACETLREALDYAYNCYGPKRKERIKWSEEYGATTRRG